MKYRKQYGQSMSPNCQFCDVVATTRNHQKVPVCRNHIDKEFQGKCLCGEWLDIRDGRFGVYYHCLNCGNVPKSKVNLQ